MEILLGRAPPVTATCMSVMLPKMSFSCPNGGAGSGLAVNPKFCFVVEKTGRSFSPSTSPKTSLRLSKSAIVTAKKNDRKSDAHSFAPKPDEATGPFPEALLLRKKQVQADGRLLPEFADAEEQELFEQLNLQLESDLKLEQMRHYEVVYLIHENCVKEVDSVNTKVQGFIKEKNGKIWRFSDWGLRRLAYKIKKAKNAHYILMNFELAANWINDFKNMLDKDERVIRHLVMKRDKAETEDCPPPPEFHTLRAGIDDDDDYDMDGDYDDEDGEALDDEDEDWDDEGETDMVGNEDDTHEGIIYVDDFMDEHSEIKDSNKNNVVGSKGRVKQKAKPVSR